MDWSLKEQVRQRRARERGPRFGGEAEVRVALLYPSPYHVGMSSLGYQTIYRRLNERPDTVCERAFLPEKPEQYRRSRTPLFTYESESSVSEFDILAFSVAYELELPGLMEVLELSGVPPRSADRADRYPLVVAGGPLTFSNPLPLGPFVDLIILGEGEVAVDQLIEVVLEAGSNRQELLERLARLPGFYVPSIHGEKLPGILAIPDEMLPAYSTLLTPDTELSDMFLIESERGCSRGCTFCVMRRSTNGGMRVVSPEKVLSLIPDDARKVGLVGAATTDHPRLPELVRAIVESGRGIGLSSLRADKMTPELVGLFRRGGYKQLTVASDGPSERIRQGLERRIQAKHLLRSAELAHDAGMKALKVYMMVGLPGETEEDIDELISFTNELSRIIPVIIGVGPYVAKRNTPLDGSPFEEIPVIERRLKRLTNGIKPRGQVRPTSAKWAWIEYRLAQGGWSMGEAAHQAWREGGSFAAWKQAILEHDGEEARPPWREGLLPPPDVLTMSPQERIRKSVLPAADALIGL